MAGRGPAPSDKAQLRRRNRAPELEKLPAEGYQGEYPALPDGYEIELDPDPDVEDPGDPLTIEVPYRAETTEWYETWARSPMATKFTAVDWNRLRWVIAPIFDAFVRRPTKDLAAELRLQEERLGGTVMDRQRMRQTIGPPEEKPKQAPKASKRSSSRESRLRAV